MIRSNERISEERVEREREREACITVYITPYD